MELAREVKLANHLARKNADKTNHGGWDWFRYASFKAVSWKWFDISILMIIFLNIITLALFQPTQSGDDGRNLVLQYIEAVFLLIYWIEFILKVLSDGLWYEKGITRPPYLRQSENILDLVIVIRLDSSEAALISLICFNSTAAGEVYARGGSHHPSIC